MLKEERLSAHRGIIIGADKNQEDLLPWWWRCYSKYNHYPVVFADFGLSPKMVRWCKERGEVAPVKLDSHAIYGPSRLSSKFVKRWAKEHGADYFQRRMEWFKKPFACQKSPFDLSLWLDVDCEVCQSLEPIFSSHDPSYDLAVVQAIGLRFSNRWRIYNSGVILFKKKAPFLFQWADLCLRHNKKYAGDDNVLSHLIRSGKVIPQELPSRFNWMMNLGFHPDILIAHWICPWGKAYIRKHGGIHGLLELT